MDNDTYVMKTDTVENMSDIISSRANEYDKIVKETTAIVDELAGHWEGATYQTFRDGYYSHLGALEDLNSSLKAFAISSGSLA